MINNKKPQIFFAVWLLEKLKIYCTLHFVSDDDEEIRREMRRAKSSLQDFVKDFCETVFRILYFFILYCVPTL